MCVGAGGLGWLEHELRSDEESDASLAHTWGSVPPFPTFSLYTTQIFTVEVLISTHNFTLHSPRITGLKKEVIFSKELLITIIRKSVMRPLERFFSSWNEFSSKDLVKK